MTAIVIRGDARALPLPDESVDLICTSPPYFGLRDYRDGEGSLTGQIGSEATPQEWLAALLECTAEWVRVLKPEGSIFVNLGDKYAGNHGTDRTRYDPKTITGHAWRSVIPAPDVQDGGRPKCLLGLPWRYALACTDRLGLILRAEIIWAKPNGLPESVTDRVRRSHEQVFHFTRQPRYYAAVDEIREPTTTADHHARYPQATYLDTPRRNALRETRHNRSTFTTDGHPLGKLPGSVWNIPSQPLTVPPGLGVDHFAAYPSELPRRIIAGWSPPGVCTGCGQGRRPVLEREVPANGQRYLVHGHGSSQSPRKFFNTNQDTARAITGYACACDGWEKRTCPVCDSPAGTVHGPGCPNADGRPLPPARPAVVLDPFGGTGTTALAASVLGRTGISVDLSHDYARLARWRTRDPGERCRIIGAPRPPPVPDGQLTLDDLATWDDAQAPRGSWRALNSLT